jgi:hypothetical protein
VLQHKHFTMVNRAVLTVDVRALAFQSNLHATGSLEDERICLGTEIFLKIHCLLVSTF